MSDTVLCEQCGRDTDSARYTNGPDEDSSEFIDELICERPGCRVGSLRPLAYKFIDRFAPSVVGSDALACIDADILECMGDEFYPGTISAKGLAVAAVRHWVAIIEGELDDLENERD